MAKIYAGIGSRKTPPPILESMKWIAGRLQIEEWVLRSGGATGADKAFELGAGTKKEIFTANSNIPSKAFEIAEEVHPKWNACSPYDRKLHARNVLQILGSTLDSPVDFVVAWTIDGCESHTTRTIKTGGTGQAISLASLLDIPVFNLKNIGRIDDLYQYLETYDEIN